MQAKAKKPKVGEEEKVQHAVRQLVALVLSLAGEVEDLDLVLRVISGPDGEDYNTAPAPLRSMGRVQVDELKAAYFTDDGAAMPAKETQESVERAANALRSAGLTVVKDQPDGLDKIMEIFKWLCVSSAKATADYWRNEYARIWRYINSENGCSCLCRSTMAVAGVIEKKLGGWQPPTNL